MRVKVFVFEDCFGTHHHRQVRSQGYDPAWVMVCREIELAPLGGNPLPHEMLWAIRFAEEAPVGYTMVVHPDQAKRSRRRPLVLWVDG
jgi:hypothetical protein